MRIKEKVSPDYSKEMRTQSKNVKNHSTYIGAHFGSSLINTEQIFWERGGNQKIGVVVYKRQWLHLAVFMTGNIYIHTNQQDIILLQRN